MNSVANTRQILTASVYPSPCIRPGLFLQVVGEQGVPKGRVPYLRPPFSPTSRPLHLRHGPPNSGDSAHLGVDDPLCPGPCNQERRRGRGQRVGVRRTQVISELRQVQRLTKVIKKDSKAVLDRRFLPYYGAVVGMSEERRGGERGVCLRQRFLVGYRSTGREGGGGISVSWRATDPSAGTE